MLKESQILIIGGDSLIAKELIKVFKKKNILKTSRRRKKKCIFFNFTEKNFQNFKNEIIKFDIIFYCLSLSNMQCCQDNPKKSYFIHSYLPIQLAKFAIGKFIYFQTNIANNKKNNYSIHKKYFEQKTKNQKNVKIIRVGKLISNEMPFIRLIKQKIKSKKKIEIDLNKKFSISILSKQNLKIKAFIKSNKKNLNIVEDNLNYLDIINRFNDLLKINIKKFNKYCVIKKS